MQTRTIIIDAPHENEWQNTIKTLLLKWRWGQHCHALIYKLELISRKVYPHLFQSNKPEIYSKSTTILSLATERGKVSNKIVTDLSTIPTDHDAVMLTYNEKDGLKISTCNKKTEADYHVNLPPFGIEHAFATLTPEKPGIFVLNDQRKSVPTDVSMYDCTECVQANKKHRIIEIPGPPASGNEVSTKGDPTTMRQCTCCKAVDGPWVKA